ncbi:hydrolase [Xanthomonas arboricola]|uniref:Hydrolase n=2 Tax=Xanthomonas arboricola TaxID=56448 RepID=A0A2S7AFK2_9XANT|nr:hydrolase [Xanthomonas arboricola]
MRVYIVHGYSASPYRHWFPWLKQELEKQGVVVSIVTLPSPDSPRPDDWQRALEVQIESMDENTYFVAHSLGGIALLKYLETAGGASVIGGYVLVSGFNDGLPILPQLDDFAKPDIDYEKISRISGHRLVIAAADDTIVPHALSERMARSLDAKFISVQHGGHFLDSDGFTEFPLVLDELRQIFGSGR